MPKINNLTSIFNLKFLKSNFLKNLLIYSSGALFLKGVSFLLIPIYTKVLAPSEFGILELLNTIITILGILFSFGLSQIVYIEYYHLDYEGKKDLIKQTINTYSVLGLPLFMISALLLAKFDYVFLNQSLSISVTMLTILSSFLIFYQNTFFSLLQIAKKALKLTVYKIVIGIFTAVFNLYLVYYLRIGYEGVLWSNFLVLALSLLYPLNLYYHFFERIKITIDISKSKKYIKLGFPFILTSLAYWALSGVDRWLILYILGKDQVGLYSVAYKFSSVYEPLLIAPVLSVYTPHIFEQFSNKDYKQRKGLLLISVLALFMLLALFSKMVAGFFIDISYHSSLFLIPYLIGGFAFFFLAQLVSAPILFFKKSKLLVINVTIAGIVNVIFNIFFLTMYGLKGAGIAFLASNFVWFALSEIQSRYVIHKAKVSLQV